MPDNDGQQLVDKENQSTKSILRASNSNDISLTSNCNGNRRSSSVHFPSDEHLVTSIHTRPSTEAQNISILYYSAQQIRQFKQKYIHRCRLLNARSLDLEQQQQVTSDTAVVSVDQLHMKPQSDDIRLQKSKAQSQPYWRRKLHKRWQSSKARSCNEENSNTNSTKTGEISYSYEDLVNYEVPVGKLLDNTDKERRDCKTESSSKPKDTAASSFVKKQCNTSLQHRLQLVDNLYLF